MARPTSLQPTEVELGILQVLWQQGTCSLGQIHEAIATSRDTGYSSTRKMVQVMRDKGMLEVDDSVRPNLYSAAMSREQTQLSMLDDLATRAFGGSSQKLVMSLVSNQRLTTGELKEIQRLIRKSERSKS